MRDVQPCSPTPPQRDIVCKEQALSGGAAFRKVSSCDDLQQLTANQSFFTDSDLQ
jgi:hypothetical protein